MSLPENLVTGNCLNHTRDSFLSADDSFPAFLKEITPEKKLENEAYAASVLAQMKDRLQSFPRLSFRRKSWRKKTIAYIQKILAEETIMNIHQVLSPVSRQAFLSELTVFWKNVRQFAPELAPDGIGQAIRNYTVYMMCPLHQTLQMLHTTGGELTTQLMLWAQVCLENQTYMMHIQVHM